MSVATEVDLRAQAERGAAELGPDATAQQVLDWAAQTFDRLIVASNMQDAVLVELAAKARPGVDVLFLDTGYHFAETIGTRDAVETVYDVRIVNATPEHTVAEQDSLLGKDLFARPCRTPWRATTPGSPACAGSRRRPGPTPRSSPTTRSSAS